jgi:hypothetical protein
LILAGAGARVRVDEGGDGVEDGGVVEAALEAAAGAVRVAGEVELVGRRAGAIVGLRAVGVEGIDERGAARLQLVRPAFGNPGGELGFGACPTAGG